MPPRVRLILPVLVLVAGACGVFGGGDTDAADPTAGAQTEPADSSVVDSSVVDSSVVDSSVVDSSVVDSSVVDSPVVGDPARAAQEPADTIARTAGQAALDSLTSLHVLLDSVLAGQRRINLRLDALDAPDTAAAADSAGDLPSSQVLGEAGRSVRSFTIATVLSVVVVILFNLLIRGVVWTLDTLAERHARRRLLFKRLVPIIRIVLWIFAAYLIVRVIFRIDAQGIFAAAAAIGVAVGFAAQDLLKNLFGGLILVFDQPFQVGDKVSVGDTYGEVVSIGLRSTRIVTADDNLVSVPNAQVVDQQVANANAGELNCQVVTDLYLPGWADEDAAKRIAFDAAVTSKYVYLNKPIVTLVSDVFKETFLTRVRVKAYVLDPRFEFLFRSDITERARAAFREAGLLRPEHMRSYLVEHSGIAPNRSAGPSRSPSSDAPAHASGTPPSPDADLRR